MLKEIKFDIDDSISLIFDGSVYTHTSTPSIHAHSLYEFIYILSKQAVFFCESQQKNLNEGNLVLVSPGTYHQIKSASATDALLHISFQVQLRTQDSKLSQIFNKIHRFAVLNMADEAYFSILMDIAKKDDLFFTDVLRLKASLMLLFSDILEDEHDQFSATSENTLSEQDIRRKKILNYVNKQYNQKPTLRELSSRLFLSEKQTQKQVTALTGSRFSYLIQEKRIACAKSLMLESKLSLDAVAKSVGYETYYGFAKAFKRIEGIPPTEFQHLQRQ